MATPTIEELQAQQDRLDSTLDELMLLDPQGMSKLDHIGVAEALLKLYKESIYVQTTAMVVSGGKFESEGALSCLRLSAELHLRIAEVLAD